MSLINLFWELNVSDSTKTLIVIGIIVGILALCFFSGKKKKNKLKQNNKNVSLYQNQDQNKNQTKCERNYMKCMVNNIKNKRNDFCYPCLDDGTAPDFFYDPASEEWVKPS